MYISKIFYTVLITFYGAVNSKLAASTDNTSNKIKTSEHSLSEIAVVSDNKCNNHENNVAVDVILFDNAPLNDAANGGILTKKNINKRQAPNDDRKQFKDRPRPDQKSLLIIFDGTGSMHDDLEQLKSGAQEIVNDLSSREDSPIFNYVLIVFRDPSIEPPFETRNPKELLERLNYINVSGGGDCPEKALSGLKLGLKLALPNSFAYVFSDASSNDYYFYDEVVALIQKKQVTVNFLLTGNCNQSYERGYKVYHDISRVSNGQVYDMNKSNVKDVLVAIKDTMKHNYNVLKSVDVGNRGTSITDLNIDKSISELKVSIAGQNPQLSIRDPSKQIVNASEELTLENLKLINIKDPKEGTWEINASATSAHSLRLSALSDLKFEFGFSLEEVSRKSETAFQPLVGHKNILSLFVSDPSLVKDLSNITVILVPLSKGQSTRQFSISLRKVNNYTYTTKPFDVPIQMFKIQLNGIDVNGNAIERLISTGLVSSSGNAPEVNVEANQKEIYEGEILQLKCIVKSHIPVEISWIFKQETLTKIHSNQSNELEFNIPKIERENHGIYKCFAVNKISSVTEEITINVMTIPKVKILAPQVIQENFEYTLKCKIDDTKEQKIQIKWLDDDDVILLNDNEDLKINPTYENDTKVVKCIAQSKDFVIEDSVSLNVTYSPKFVSQHVNSTYNSVYGSKITLDCTSFGNPPNMLVIWRLYPKNSNLTKEVSNHSGILTLEKVQEDHEGLYECLVKNELGEIRRQFSVTLIPKAPPKIITESTHILLNDSNSIQLSCECKNCLPLTNFTWTYDNVEKDYEQFFIKDTEDDAFKTVIKLVDVDETDNGTFQCIMWNSLGEKKLSIEVIVQSMPKIEGIILNNDENEFELDENYELLEGKNFSVECIADGSPEPSILWAKNKIIIANESVLNIDYIRAEDEGDYECIAANPLGATKKAFHIQVNYPPRRAKREIDTSYEAIENGNVTLVCDLLGSPQPNISWQINAKDILNNDKFLIEDNLLKFLANADDSGLYKCIGINKYGASSIEFSVTVMSSPKILSPNDESMKLSVQSPLELNCIASGYPKPDIKFFKDNKLVTNESIYTIPTATFSDSGTYTCSAENQVGISEKVFYVVVVEAPKIVSTFENLTVLNVDQREVFCIAHGFPQPVIKWLLNSYDLIQTYNPLKINSSFSSGKISCVAENSEGNDEKYFHLEVLKQPIIFPGAQDLKKSFKIKENDDIELLCPFENYENITWTLNGNQLDHIQHKIIEKKIFIINANRGLNGNWTCTVSNKAGTNEFSYQIDILASPTIRASWILNDEVSEFLYTESDVDEKILKRGESLILNCTANGSPMPQKIQWRKGSDLIGEGDTLAIENLDFYHSDIYTCSAENTLGIVKKFFKIDVVSAPFVDDSVQIEKSFEKLQGESVILKCNSIMGNPAPLFFWFKDSEILDDEADDHLIIDSLEVKHDGKYRCLAKNRFGSVKLDFEISIYEPAKILSIDKFEENDDSIKLTCESKGNPLPIMSWTMNGHILSSTAKLNINKLLNKVSDNTLYFDGYGNGISFLDPFKIKTMNKKIYSKLTKINDKILKLDLNFKNKNNLHQRKFNCYTFNALGKDENSIEVQISQKPYLKTPNKSLLQDYEILENMPLLLSCFIDGFPQPKISWLKNGMKIYENETIEFINNRKILRISETSPWNSGNYSCAGKNDFGQIELKFKVLILSPPKLKKLPNANLIHNDADTSLQDKDENEEIIEILKGSNVILECIIEASPKAKIHWVRISSNDPEKELIETEENFLPLNSVQDSSTIICFANNSIGTIQKLYHIHVQYPPLFIKNDKPEEFLTVKLHHSINLDCTTKASPEAITFWIYNSTNLTKFTNDYYFTTDYQIIRITNANKNHEGKYICTSANKFGQVQKVFYVKIEIPIQYSPWSDWSECSASCGTNGIQYRSRTCVLLDSTPSYNCSGENIQVRKCNELPCPVNGGWGNFTNFSACPKCYDPTQAGIPKQKRFRKCDNPPPSFGGLNCIGSNEEVRECKYLSPCKINGGWGDWSEWTPCSKTCGKGYKSRKRLCNNPAPKYNGRDCEGENYEYEECKIKPCSNNGLLKSLKNDFNNDIYESTENYGSELRNDEYGNTRRYQYMQQREVEYVPDQKKNSYKIKVTLDTYKPISEETYKTHVNSVISDEMDLDEDYFETNSFEESVDTTEAPVRFTTEKHCGQGFKYNRIYKQCEEVDECKSRYLNNCRHNERCINTIGSYRCEKIF